MPRKFEYQSVILSIWLVRAQKIWEIHVLVPEKRRSGEFVHSLAPALRERQLCWSLSFA